MMITYKAAKLRDKNSFRGRATKVFGVCWKLFNSVSSGDKVTLLGRCHKVIEQSFKAEVNLASNGII